MHGLRSAARRCVRPTKHVVVFIRHSFHHPTMSNILELPSPGSEGQGVQLDVSTGAPVKMDSMGPLVGK